jgi:redox-sensing transcriptional repressor
LPVKKIIKKKLIDQASEPTLKRLPVYLHYLQKMESEGVVYVSAPTMAPVLEFDSTQIVKDLSVTGIKGKPKVGYNVSELIKTIEEYLGFNKRNEAFLVGAGKLGQAILSFHELQSIGITIIAAFDVDPNKIDTEYGHIPILHIDKLGVLALRIGVSIGILTTPHHVAQEAAEALVKSGITAIWNLTPVKLKLPDNIIVQDTSMFSNVAVLMKKYYNSLQM